jgi:hypothetical protein
LTKHVRIKIGTIEVLAELNDTKTAGAIFEALPIKGRANLWGDEIYFPIPVKLELEVGSEFVKIGDLGYWPDGHAFCIFFGPTPISQGDKIQPASAVTVFGRIANDTAMLKKVASGSEVIIEKIGDS